MTAADWSRNIIKFYSFPHKISGVQSIIIPFHDLAEYSERFSKSNSFHCQMWDFQEHSQSIVISSQYLVLFTKWAKKYSFAFPDFLFFDFMCFKYLRLRCNFCQQKYWCLMIFWKTQKITMEDFHNDNV